MLLNIWKNPFEMPGIDLCGISTGVTVSEEVSSDILNAEKVGADLWEQFKMNRLSTERNIKFFHKLPRTKLKSFPT